MVVCPEFEFETESRAVAARVRGSFRNGAGRKHTRKPLPFLRRFNLQTVDTTFSYHKLMHSIHLGSVNRVMKDRKVHVGVDASSRR